MNVARRAQAFMCMYVLFVNACKEVPTSSYISHSMFNPCLEYSTGQCVQGVWSAPLNS